MLARQQIADLILLIFDGCLLLIHCWCEKYMYYFFNISFINRERERESYYCHFITKNKREREREREMTGGMAKYCIIIVSILPRVGDIHNLF